MSYGCRIWDAQGNLILDTNDYTARIIYIDTKPGDSQGITYLAEANGTRPLLLVVPAEIHAQRTCLNVNITSNGWLSWKPVWSGYYNWVNNQWSFVPVSIISKTTTIIVCVCDEKV